MSVYGISTGDFDHHGGAISYGKKVQHLNPVFMKLMHSSISANEEFSADFSRLSLAISSNTQALVQYGELK
jgi:hypothetical protein